MLTPLSHTQQTA
jgi:hypothetical protein